MSRNRCKDRYGLSSDQIANLNKRWNRFGLSGGGWADFDEFIKWSAENEYRDGSRLRKINEEEPHGPDNSFWFISQRGQKAKRLKIEDAPVRDLCAGCTKECGSQLCGCVEWRSNFVAYWNRYIHRDIVIKPKGRQFWQYEHPDLVRMHGGGAVD